MRQATEQGFKLIQQFEGFMSLPYLDVAGYGTIGYGHFLTKSELMSGKVKILRSYVDYREGLSECQASILLDQDLREVEQGLSNDLATQALTDYQYDALVSFTMNVGLGAFRSSTMRKLLLAKQRDLAALQFPRWCYAGGKVVRGLVRRREAEQKLFLHGQYQ